jgi:hypothetical protein
MLGGAPVTETVFDTEIITHINTALFNLTQIGVGPKIGFSITSDAETWDEFLDNSKNFEAVKTYVYLKVRLVFDPPSSASVIEAFTNTIAELESRLNYQAETEAFLNGHTNVML